MHKYAKNYMKMDVRTAYSKCTSIQTKLIHDRHSSSNETRQRTNNLTLTWNKN